MLTEEISCRFTTYFQESGHAVLPSSPLTHPDPTLLFVNSGMVQFKPYFTGEVQPPSSRLTTVQRCLRTVDIEQIGHTNRHLTFFQMCGNFSFNDYFREESITLLWTFLTGSVESGCLGLDSSRLWVTVLHGDEETKQCWLTLTSVKPSQIQERGVEDNYWTMGVPGPGGPCTEVYYDRGSQYGEEGGPVRNEDRYVEIWNIVLMEHELSNVRSKTNFTIGGNLPQPCVDTGMGLERVSCIVQNVDSVFETDQLFPLIQQLETLTGREYEESEEVKRRFRLITDHVRSSTMLMGEQVRPGNSGQSYGLRRLLRRSVRSLHVLTDREDLLRPLLETSLTIMGQSYSELEQQRDFILETGEREERQFRKVLQRGLRVLESEMQRSTGVIGGEVGFRLTSTLGFPVELTRDVCEERGFVFDQEGYDELWDQHRRVSRG